jgi:RNA polymerase-interacting CarD/CdnL/TRCF family regulator
MDFHVGDPVIHWTYGMGEIVRMEEKNLPGQSALYYVVQTHDLTVWVPADEQAANRLRLPTSQSEFEKLFAILGSPAENLPGDRLERRTYLVNVRKEGGAEANCRVIRDLSSLGKTKALNDHDRMILKQAQESLLSEWTFSLSVPLADARVDLGRLLDHPQQSIAA